MKQSKHLLKIHASWYHLTYHSGRLDYRVKGPWIILFACLGLSTKLSLEINTILNYQWKKGNLGPSLVLQVYEHKANQKLNIRNMLPIWGLNRLSQEVLTHEIDKVIQLSKSYRNVALNCIDPKLIRQFYDQQLVTQSEHSNDSLLPQHIALDRSVNPHQLDLR